MLPNIDILSNFIEFYALIISLIGVLLSTKKLKYLWRTKHLRKVWGIKDGDHVTVVCSELEEPEKRQNVEPREFIYNLKYGDVDAYFEVIITLLRLYPGIKLRILSSGEAQNTRIDYAQNLILVGGPDYNKITDRILKKGITQYYYISPFAGEKSESYPDEIVIIDKQNNIEYCEFTNEKDFGYFERIKNPNNPDFNIILIGGCHTIGVTAAIRAFSLAHSERGEIPEIVLKNAKIISRQISKKSEFSVLFSAERIGQTINVPIVDKSKIIVNN